MTMPLRVFVGYDTKEPLAYHVLTESILRRTSQPVAFVPLVQSVLRHRGFYTRERGLMETTEFSMTRFLVPYLSDYTGYSIFLDCDMLCRVDLGDLFLPVLTQPGKAVYVCQHAYTPAQPTKFLGQAQVAYPRKNWSSLMVFDNARCQALTPEYVNTATGLMLHRFMWASEHEIGSLPLEWNWLVGEYPPNPDAKILHYTLGGPWFEETRTCDHADQWLEELRALTEASSLRSSSLGHG